MSAKPAHENAGLIIHVLSLCGIIRTVWRWGHSRKGVQSSTILLLVLTLSGCSLRTAQVSYAAANVADLLSTQAALSRGAVEINPLMQMPWYGQAAMKAAATVGVWWAGERLESRGHRVLATVLTGALATATAIVAGHNYRLAGQ